MEKSKKQKPQQTKKVSHTVLQSMWDYTKPKPLGFLLKPKWACLPGHLVSPFPHTP